jgi:hypothetical protein
VTQENLQDVRAQPPPSASKRTKAFRLRFPRPPYTDPSSDAEPRSGPVAPAAQNRPGSVRLLCLDIGGARDPSVSRTALSRRSVTGEASA